MGSITSEKNMALCKQVWINSIMLMQLEENSTYCHLEIKADTLRDHLPMQFYDQPYA